MNKTITSFNIRDYSTCGTGRGGATTAAILVPFLMVFSFVIGYNCYATGNWAGLTATALIGGTLVAVLIEADCRFYKNGVAKRKVFLEKWEEEFGHEGPTKALDNIYLSFTCGGHRCLVTEVYSVDGVSRFLSVVNNGSLVFEVTE